MHRLLAVAGLEGHPTVMNHLVVECQTHVVGHHALLLAIPAFFPAVIVVGVISYIAIRDRRQKESDDTLAEKQD
ncbi:MULTISPECIES: hypothetical protein [Mycobacterium]|uniref:Uncharacterized protein n=1 Tax=Mycobacterium kiyosense TaxID=2871094 RepID=A0A9P3UZJ9_9MYCO|nr:MULTISPECIES: hypothetical protein [Mycobacterium]BDB42919.1 hypothetical protein IWGMT90018_33650 [Mycobacterium kiyosense]BDE13850.1 hypothetical protein MKCMC460_27100 [Mycobacterium sp. 20KCMC460]GLB83739.1 hypothetical protein SRL2020028_29950 [Mycobacterium kiyosense]GLB91378.1 hypothetical protein SRL2020130_41950 [Mycobacterium kiyosense]GLB97253.1 hypothetical protein SRL2020226_40290 [Mycobacterium kiyosense]